MILYRYEKCLFSGMRPNWILSEEERVRRFHGRRKVGELIIGIRFGYVNSLNYVLSELDVPKIDLFCILRISKTMFKLGFSKQSNQLNLNMSVGNSTRIFNTIDIGCKCWCLRLLKYKTF